MSESECMEEDGEEAVRVWFVEVFVALVLIRLYMSPSV